jgi:hypothetical protein
MLQLPPGDGHPMDVHLMGRFGVGLTADEQVEAAQLDGRQLTGG